MIRLDNKYMIQMAENRGLFGRTASSSSHLKGSRGSRKKQNKPSTPPPKTKRRIKDAEIARIAAPTHTFLRHIKDSCEMERCDKCRLEEERIKTRIYRNWWTETSRHIIALKRNLIRHKIIAKMKKKSVDAGSVLQAFGDGGKKVDEIIAKSRQNDELGVPIFPRLKLSREFKLDKTAIHLPITDVKLIF